MPGLGMTPVDAIVKYPFGHGLSYSEFSYSNFAISKTSFGKQDTAKLELTLTNTGKMKAAEVVQVYFEDPVASVARPVRQLVEFAKVELNPGESTAVSFEIPMTHFAYTAADYTLTLDQGVIELLIGRSSQHIEHRETITIT